MRILLAFVILSLATPAMAYEVREVKTPGGVTAWLMRDTSLPVISMRFAFRKGGYARVSAEQQGVPAITARLLTEGAGDKNAKAFRAALENKAIEMNFSVTEDEFFGNLKTLTEHQDTAFALLKQAITAPRFDDAPLSHVKEEMETEQKQVEEDADSLAAKLFRETAFASHPYGEDPLGSKESRAKISAKELQAFVKERFVKPNLVIAVAGDIDEATLKRLLSETFDGLPSTAPELPALPPLHLPSDQKNITRTFPGPQTVVEFGLPGVARSDKRFYAWYLLNYIIGGDGLTSRLNDEIREKKGLAYYTYTSPESLDAGAYLYGGFASRNESVGEASAILKRVLGEVSSKGFTPDELKAAKQYMLGSFPLQLDTLRARSNFLLVMELEHLGLDYLEKRNSYIRKVTLKDMNDLAREYLDPKGLFIITVGNASGPETPTH